MLDERTKVVVRRLPPTLKEKDFRKWLADENVEGCNWIRFHNGKATPFSEHTFAFLSFDSAADVLKFFKQANGHSFVDARGASYRCQIAYAPFQRLPKPDKRDNRVATIESDPDYIAFVAELEKGVKPLEAPSMSGETDTSTAAVAAATDGGPVVTPLMQAVADRRRGGTRATPKAVSTIVEVSPEELQDLNAARVAAQAPRAQRTRAARPGSGSDKQPRAAAAAGKVQQAAPQRPASGRGGGKAEAGAAERKLTLSEEAQAAARAAGAAPSGEPAAAEKPEAGSAPPARGDRQPEPGQSQADCGGAREPATAPKAAEPRREKKVRAGFQIFQPTVQRTGHSRLDQGSDQGLRDYPVAPDSVTSGRDEVQRSRRPDAGAASAAASAAITAAEGRRRAAQRPAAVARSSAAGAKPGSPASREGKPGNTGRPRRPAGKPKARPSPDATAKGPAGGCSSGSTPADTRGPASAAQVAPSSTQPGREAGRHAVPPDPAGLAAGRAPASDSSPPSTEGGGGHGEAAGRGRGRGRGRRYSALKAKPS